MHTEPLYRVSRKKPDADAVLLFIGPMTSLRSILLLHKDAILRIEAEFRAGAASAKVWTDRATPWTLEREHTSRQIVEWFQVEPFVL